jgi:hypothetical protein
LLGSAAGAAAGGFGEGRRAVLEEGLLPLVELRGRDVVFFAHLGDGALLQQMLAEDWDFLCGTELSAAVGWFVLLVVAQVLFRSGKVSCLTPDKRTFRLKRNNTAERLERQGRINQGEKNLRNR